MSDQSRGLDPESLSLHIFSDEIPVSRITENRAEHSISAVYAVFKTFINLLEMGNADGTEVEKLFISVRCGYSSRSFKLFGEHIIAHLGSRHSVRTPLCSPRSSAISEDIYSQLSRRFAGKFVPARGSTITSRFQRGQTRPPVLMFSSSLTKGTSITLLPFHTHLSA